MKSYKLQMLEKELAEIESWLIDHQVSMIEGTASEEIRVKWRKFIVLLENVGAKIVKLEGKENG